MQVRRLSFFKNRIDELQQQGDELQQQVDELTPVDSILSTASVNWSAADSFYFQITANQTFSFSNVTNGKTITLIVRNNSTSQRVLTFPAGSYKEEYFSGRVDALTENVYTIISSNNKIYIAEIRGLTNA